MKITLSSNQVVNELMEDNNASRTYEEARALAEYYEELEDSLEEEIELDVVAIRCEWSSYTVEELIEQFGESSGLDEVNEESIVEYIEEQTIAIEVDGNYLIIDF